MRVYDAGEKIKKLRLEIGLKQEDLASDEVTRGLIGMIENNRRNLTYKTARVIAEKLNQYYAAMGKEITPDFLLETKQEQAERMIKDELDKMRARLRNPSTETAEMVEESMERLIGFAKEWKLDAVMAQLHEARGRFYYETYQYNKALQDYFVAKEIHWKGHNWEKLAEAYNIMGIIYYGLMIYEQSLLHYNQAQQIIATNQLDHCTRLVALLVYNKILCYRRLNQCDLVFKEISNYKKLDYYDKKVYLEVLLIEANAFSDLGNYEKAIKIYERLLAKHGGQLEEISLLVYSNYADALRRKGAYQKSLEKLDEGLKIQEDRPKYTIELLLSSAQTYYALGHTEKALEQINRGLILAEKINDSRLTVELHLLYVKIYIDKKEYNTAETVLNKLENFIKEDDPFSSRLADIQVHYLLLYERSKKLDKLAEYIQGMYESRKA